MKITIELTEAQAVYVRDQIDANLHSLKNCIASAVERGPYEYAKSGQTGFEYAQNLTIKLREREAAFKAVNGAILRADGTIN